MLDLSEDPLEENIATCVEYLERMSKSNLLLEMELGITGGEEDGVDNSDVDSSKLYTQPEEVWQVYEALSKVPNGKFTVAAAFGNVHGVYSPGNVRLEPQILHNTQKFISEKLGGDDKKPVYFVFHGGSGSSTEDIQYAIEAGTIKMNIDTDTQWSFWDGIREYEAANHDYLQAQIGNPDGADKPNKKYYDPRMCLRSAEEATVERLGALRRLHQFFFAPRSSPITPLTGLYERRQGDGGLKMRQRALNGHVKGCFPHPRRITIVPHDRDSPSRES